LDGKSATGCTNPPPGDYHWDWQEWYTWDAGNGGAFTSPEGGFKLPHGGWFFFNVKYQTEYGTPYKDWCDSSPDGYSTGVKWVVWVDNQLVSITLVDNNASGCSGRFWVGY